MQSWWNAPPALDGGGGRGLREQVGLAGGWLWQAFSSGPLSPPSLLKWDKVNLLAASNHTDVGSNSTLHIQAGLKKISEHICPTFGLSGSLPTLNWDAGYKGQRGLGRSCFGSVGRTTYLLPPLSCAWDPRGWSDLLYGISGAQGCWNYKSWEQQTETKQPCIKCSKYFSKLRLQATNGLYYLPFPIPKYLLLGSWLWAESLAPDSFPGYK